MIRLASTTPLLPTLAFNSPIVSPRTGGRGDWNQVHAESHLKEARACCGSRYACYPISGSASGEHTQIGLSDNSFTPVIAVICANARQQMRLARGQTTSWPPAMRLQRLNPGLSILQAIFRSNPYDTRHMHLGSPKGRRGAHKSYADVTANLRVRHRSDS